MPSIVALMLCVVFVLYGLSRIKAETRPSLTIWLPTLWLMYGGSRQIVYWLSGTMISDNGSTPEEGSQIDRIFLSGLIVLAIVVLVRRRINWRIVFDRNRWLMALYGYAFISILWSDLPFSSFKRYVRLAGAILMALVILTEQSPREALETVYKRLVYILIPFSIVLVKYYPNLGVAYRAHSGGKSWIGVTMGKNQLGVLCVVSAFFLIWNFFTLRQSQRRSRSRAEVTSYFLVLALSVYLMFGEGAYSATALVCLPAGIATFFLLRWTQRRSITVSTKALLVPITVCFFVGASLPFLGTTPIAGLTGFLGRDATLTSRTSIWEILVQFVAQSPLLGQGYGAFWTRETVSAAGVNEAHNGYLEVILILGITGLIPLFGFIASCCTRARRSLMEDRDPSWAIFAFCLITMLILHEATEASFLAETDLLWTSVIFVTTSYYSSEALEASEIEDLAGEDACVPEEALA